MRRRPSLLFLLLVPFVLGAWTPASEERIARKAVMLAPPDMRLLIDKFRPEFREGLAAAAAEEAAGGRMPHGALKGRIETEIAAAITAVRSRQPMSDFIHRLGTIAHLVADANNPFHLAPIDPRLPSHRHDYEAYFERRLPVFPTVFYGLDDRFSVGRYLDGTLARTAGFNPLLAEEYYRAGRRRTSTEFDDRSTAFGIASLCYSHAVTDLVNIYFHIWKSAGGDVRIASVMRKGNLLLNEYDQESPSIRIGQERNQ